MENKTPEEILSKYEDNNEYHFHNVDRKWVIQAIEEYGKQQYNQAVLDCIGNATLRFIPFSDNMEVDKESMKKLLKQ